MCMFFLYVLFIQVRDRDADREVPGRPVRPPPLPEVRPLLSPPLVQALPLRALPQGQKGNQYQTTFF